MICLLLFEPLERKLSRFPI